MQSISLLFFFLSLPYKEVIKVLPETYFRNQSSFAFFAKNNEWPSLNFPFKQLINFCSTCLTTRTRLP